MKFNALKTTTTFKKKHAASGAESCQSAEQNIYIKYLKT